MHADWIQSIERQLAEVPPGCLLESPVSQAVSYTHLDVYKRQM